MVQCCACNTSSCCCTAGACCIAAAARCAAASAASGRPHRSASAGQSSRACSDARPTALADHVSGSGWQQVRPATAFLAVGPSARQELYLRSVLDLAAAAQGTSSSSRKYHLHRPPALWQPEHGRLQQQLMRHWQDCVPGVHRHCRLRLLAAGAAAAALSGSRCTCRTALCWAQTAAPAGRCRWQPAYAACKHHVRSTPRVVHRRHACTWNPILNRWLT